MSGKLICSFLARMIFQWSKTEERIEEKSEAGVVKTKEMRGEKRGKE